MHKTLRQYSLLAFPLLFLAKALDLQASQSGERLHLIRQESEVARPLLKANVRQEVSNFLYRQITISETNPELVFKAFYGIHIKPKQVERMRRELWGIWKEVNRGRLDVSHLKSYSEHNTRDRAIYWMIPEGRVMPIVLHSQGGKPREGRAMIIQLHGGGKDPNATSIHSAEMNNRDWEANIKISSNYKSEGTLYFVPRMPDDRVGRWYLRPEHTAFRRAYQLAVLTGEVDPNRVYLMGISEGGYGSHRLARYMPDYFAGVGPMAAAEPLVYAENLRALAFRLAVGTEDKGFGRNKFAALWQEALSKLAKEHKGDYIHHIDLQQGKGHFIDYSQTAPWLLQHKRRVSPERISYTLHNMTPDYAETNYSPGVYWLDFRGLSMSERTATLTIDAERIGNEYNLRLTEGVGRIRGKLGIYLDKMDYTKAVIIRINGKVVYEQKVRPSLGAMLDALALWGDPERLFASKVEIEI